MTIITILAILAVPGTVYIFGEAVLKLHEMTLKYLEKTATVGGQPVELIKQSNELQAEQVRNAAAEQKALMERLKERKLSAIGE